MAIDDTIKAAMLRTQSENLANVRSRLGTHTDVEDASGETLFNRVNSIMYQYRSVWTETRAAKLDLVGSTGDTGSAATIFGRLRNIMDSFSDTWTAARAAQLDLIGSAADPSTAATLFGRLSSLSSQMGSSIGTNVSTILSRIGASTDLTTAATLFGRIQRTYDYLTTNWTAARAAMLGNIGTATDTAGAATIFGQLGAVNATVGALGTVKSVQRGISTIGTVTLARSVDMNKSLCIHSGMDYATYGVGFAYEGGVYLASANTITIRSFYTTSRFIWQVIEFY